MVRKCLLLIGIAMAFASVYAKRPGRIEISLQKLRVSIDSSYVKEMDIGSYTQNDERIIFVNERNASGLYLIQYLDSAAYSVGKDFRTNTGVFDSATVTFNDSSFMGIVTLGLQSSIDNTMLECLLFDDNNMVIVGYFRVDEKAGDASEFTLGKFQEHLHKADINLNVIKSKGK